MTVRAVRDIQFLPDHHTEFAFRVVTEGSAWTTVVIAAALVAIIVFWMRRKRRRR